MQRLSRIQKQVLPQMGLPPLPSSDLMTLNLTSSFPATLFTSILEEVPIKKTHLQYEGVTTQMYRVTRVLAGRGTARSLPCQLWLLVWLFPPRFVFHLSKWHGEGRESLTWIGLGSFTYGAKAGLSKTHMHANVNPHQSWWGTHGIYGGMGGLTLLK